MRLRDAAYECIVIGGGPAGSLAAVYLARFCRRVLIIDAGKPRARWIPRTRNVPAYPDGLTGEELLERLREQRERYDIGFAPAEAQSIEGSIGAFTVHTAGNAWRARRVLLATGVEDRMPEALEHLWTLVKRGEVRLCPVCDAFEVRGHRLGLIAAAPVAEREQRFLSNYSASLRVFHPEAVMQVLTSSGGVAVKLKDGELAQVDALYVALGVQVGSRLASALGARCDEDGYLAVDQKQQTSVPGLYAAGDVVQSLSQISVAFGQAAIAASAINVALTAEQA